VSVERRTARLCADVGSDGFAPVSVAVAASGNTATADSPTINQKMATTERTMGSGYPPRSFLETGG
jgi:hypothetical protein